MLLADEFFFCFSPLTLTFSHSPSHTLLLMLYHLSTYLLNVASKYTLIIHTLSTHTFLSHTLFHHTLFLFHHAHQVYLLALHRYPPLLPQYSPRTPPLAHPRTRDKGCAQAQGCLLHRVQGLAQRPGPAELPRYHPPMAKEDVVLSLS